VIGALTARPIQPGAVEPVPVSAASSMSLDAKTSASGLYWAITSLLCGLGLAYFGLIGEGMRPIEVALAIALGLPFVQLAASGVAAVVILMSKRVGKDVRMKHLGRITARAFVGAVIGIVLMLPLLALCK
jgi:hypothetical protein